MIEMVKIEKQYYIFVFVAQVNVYFTQNLQPSTSVSIAAFLLHKNTPFEVRRFESNIETYRSHDHWSVWSRTRLSGSHHFAVVISRPPPQKHRACVLAFETRRFCCCSRKRQYNDEKRARRPVIAARRGFLIARKSGRRSLITAFNLLCLLSGQEVCDLEMALLARERDTATRFFPLGTSWLHFRH